MSLSCFLILYARITCLFSACKWCMFYFPFLVLSVRVVKLVLYRVMYRVPRLLDAR